MYKVFGDMLSGNCYKIELLMQFIGIPHEWIHIDILAGETHTEKFKQMNPNERIPVVELGDGEYLWESNAILNYQLKQGASCGSQKPEKSSCSCLGNEP